MKNYEKGDAAIFNNWGKSNINSEKHYCFILILLCPQYFPWDADMGSLVSFQTVEALATPIEVQMYNGKFDEIGILNFYFGYRLADGMVVYSPDSLKLTIVE